MKIEPILDSKMILENASDEEPKGIKIEADI